MGLSSIVIMFGLDGYWKSLADSVFCCGSGLPNNWSTADSSVKYCLESILLVSCLFSGSLMAFRSGSDLGASRLVVAGDVSLATGVGEVGSSGTITAFSVMGRGRGVGPGSGSGLGGKGSGSMRTGCGSTLVNCNSIMASGAASTGICLMMGISKKSRCKASAKTRESQMPALFPVLDFSGICPSVCIAK